MKQITSNEFTNEVLASPTPVLVDCYTDYCMPCRRLAPVIEEIESASGGAFKVVKVDAGTELQLAASFRINAVPTFVPPTHPPQAFRETLFETLRGPL